MNTRQIIISAVAVSTAIGINLLGIIDAAKAKPENCIIIDGQEFCTDEDIVLASPVDLIDGALKSVLTDASFDAPSDDPAPSCNTAPGRCCRDSHGNPVPCS